jgi:hypothetical protein
LNRLWFHPQSSPNDIVPITTINTDILIRATELMSSDGDIVITITAFDIQVLRLLGSKVLGLAIDSDIDRTIILDFLVYCS